MGKIALFSIMPCYLPAMRSGKKQYEFRRIPCRCSITKIVFYASAPISSIIGEAKTEQVVSGTPDTVWSIVQSTAGISREAFDTYFDKRTYAYAYRLSNVLFYDKEIPITCINKYPPQSFYYLSDIQYMKIRLTFLPKFKIAKDC